MPVKHFPQIKMVSGRRGIKFKSLREILRDPYFVAQVVNAGRVAVLSWDRSRKQFSKYDHTLPPPLTLIEYRAMIELSSAVRKSFTAKHKAKK